MATTGVPDSTDEVERFTGVELPANRSYSQESLYQLDSDLADAIQSAEAAGQMNLAKLLSRELGSLYYSTR